MVPRPDQSKSLGASTAILSLRRSSTASSESTYSFKPHTLLKESMVHAKGKQGGAPASIRDWGYPGFLSDEEYRVFEQFRDEVMKRDDGFRSTVFCFERAHEDEAYALCRWLRARKFKLLDTIKMVEEATLCRAEAASHDFYPDPSRALGVDETIYISQYPQMYCGRAKNGCPLFISKPGSIQASGVECITTLEGIIRYHWYGMMVEYANQLQLEAETNPDFKRYEIVCVMDLKHLTMAKISKRILNIVQVQSEIDSLCFPETLCRMVVINAPSFFAMTWKMMKKWVDVRTANKVDILGTDRAKWERKLRELVDVESLPSDYGGKADKSNDQLEMKVTSSPSAASLDPSLCPSGQDPLLFSVRSHESRKLCLSKGETAKIRVFTRSMCGGSLSITGPNGRKLGKKIQVRHTGKGIDEEEPTIISIGVGLSMPGVYKLKIDKSGSPLSTDNFLVVVNRYRKAVKSQSPVLRPTQPKRVKRGAKVAVTTCHESNSSFTTTSETPIEVADSFGKKSEDSQEQVDQKEAPISLKTGLSAARDEIEKGVLRTETTSSSEVTEEVSPTYFCGGLESIQNLLGFGRRKNIVE